MRPSPPPIAVAPPPPPRSEHGSFLVAGVVCLIGVGLLAFVLTGAWHGRHSADLPAPPPIVIVRTPVAAASATTSAAGATAPIVARPTTAEQASVSAAGASTVHIPAAWEARFYPIYERASATFDVNWLLLASIHKQETDFSTAPTTYHGLNFAGCCGGPMQFNVTNGPVTTWKLVSTAYRFAARPRSYDHQTAAHPSIYDDFDSIMAAGWLLYSDGATSALDGSAWEAAYDYYGHDTFGVTYADQVLARAIGWSQHGFCVNCGVDQDLVDAVDAAYGAPARADLEAAQAAAVATAATAKKKSGRPRRHAAATD